MTHAVASQVAWFRAKDESVETRFPPPSNEVIQGVKWGHFDELFTPAFWKFQVLLQINRNRYAVHRIGKNLAEEVAACLLGGYGIPAELGLLAFRRIRRHGLIADPGEPPSFEELLARPFDINGTARRYRFARQKSKYLSQCLNHLKKNDAPREDLELRRFLLELPGIGPKTASWIVRNHLNSSQVAILDIHLLRAGRIMNLFGNIDDPTKNYFELENRFLDFCRAIEVPASVLDAVIWDFMRRIGPTANKATNARRRVRVRKNLIPLPI